MLDSEDVNLIITDVMMPQMDGFELCKFLKARKNYSHIPIVMLSAKSDTASKIAGLEAGAAAYIEKPFFGRLPDGADCHDIGKSVAVQGNPAHRILFFRRSEPSE